MQQTTDESFILKAITAAIEVEITDRINTVIADAIERLEKEVLSAADKIVLSVLAEYDVSTQGSHIIIKVKKDV